MRLLINRGLNITINTIFMNTKIIMASCAFTLAAAGIMLTFMPDEILNYFEFPPTTILQVLLQITGALYFAFAMLNWMSKSSPVGGIYNKPIAMANFMHFIIGAIALIKLIFANSDLPFAVWIMAGVYAIFAIVFGLINFRSPSAGDKKS